MPSGASRVQHEEHRLGWNARYGASDARDLRGATVAPQSVEHDVGCDPDTREEAMDVEIAPR